MFNNNEVINVEKIISAENTQGFEAFMKGFSGLEYEASFSNNETVKHDLHSNGLISTYDLFDLMSDYSEPVQDVQEFLDEYGDMEVLEDKYDNTYNYNSPIDNYIEFGTFDLENDQTLVTMSVCLGLDPRAGYTKQVCFIFDDEYAFLDAMSTDFALASFEFTVKGKSYYGGFDANAFSEYGLLSVNEKETDEEVYYDEAFASVDDLDDLKEAIADALEVESNDVEISSVDYIWEC